MLQLIDALELIHSLGYTHNDIKTDNIMLDISPTNPADITATLIDFGFFQEFLNTKTGQHIVRSDLNMFRGNLIFASPGQMDFHTTSRKDDLISICYLMIMLINRFKFP